jgi:hypothetical protein
VSVDWAVNNRVSKGLKGPDTIEKRKKEKKGKRKGMGRET